MRLTLRKDTSFDLPPARNARKWQLAKEEAARQGRGGDIREIINIYTLMALLPTYKSHAAVQKAAGDADATTRSGKPISPAAAPAYAQARRIWRQDGMAGASRLAEALERDYGRFSRQDHLDAADHHEQSQHRGSKADQACHRIASWSHQMAADADTDMQQAVQDTKKSLAEVTGLLKTYIKAMPAARNASRPRLSLRKAVGHTYTSRERASNGSWRYHYAGDAHEGIGKTQSGKAVPHPAGGEYRNHMPGDTKFADYSQQDHADAHKLHSEAGKKLAAEADDIQHAYATRHGNASVRENSQQADASAAHFRSATAARTMAQAHVDAAVTHARLGGMAKSLSSRRPDKAGAARPVEKLCKAPGDRGATILGKTRSGAPIYASSKGVAGGMAPHAHAMSHAPTYTAQDHLDAGEAHVAAATKIAGAPSSTANASSRQAATRNSERHNMWAAAHLGAAKHLSGLDHKQSIKLASSSAQTAERHHGLGNGEQAQQHASLAQAYVNHAQRSLAPAKKSLPKHQDHTGKPMRAKLLLPARHAKLATLIKSSQAWRLAEQSSYRDADGQGTAF